MSFIHDALKKSEAERRRGEVPRLQNEPFSPLPRRRPFWPLLLILALLLNGAVLGWWVLSREEPSTTVAADAGGPGRTAGAKAASPQPVSVTAAASAERAAAVPVATAPASDPVAVAAEPAPRSAAHSLPEEPAVATVVVEEKPVAAVTPHAAPAPGKAAENWAPTRRPEPSAPTRSKAAAAPAAESYPPIADLSGDVRSGLPGLDLQLHFFTPDAERRLVRLNGANLREGDRSGDGLSVVEITSEGVKLSHGGVRFFLPTGRP
jgi:general secretion pathway protein B